MSEYIIPGYIRIESRENGYYLINQYTDRIVRIDLKYEQDLKDILDREDLSNKTELVGFLIKNEMLIKENDFESYIDKYFQIENEILSVIIFTTEQCNFRCKYCYEDFKYGSMSDENYDLIYNFIKGKLESKEFKYLCLNWFGGEPLLCHQKIVEFNSRLLELSSENDVIFNSSITTNGYLLKPEVFSELYDSGVSRYQITIDGSFHDDLRVMKNGDKTRDTILDNISKILIDKKRRFSIILRNNILKYNNDYVWYDQVADSFGLDDRIFIHVHPVSPLGGDNGLNMIRDKRELDLTLNKHISYLTKIGLQNYDDTYRFSVCYASLKNNYAFRPNGEIVTCTVDLNDARNKIGSFTNSKIMIDDSKMNKWSNKINYDKCKVCSNFVNCPLIICPSKKGNDKYCDFMRLSLEQKVTDHV